MSNTKLLESATTGGLFELFSDRSMYGAQMVHVRLPFHLVLHEAAVEGGHQVGQVGYNLNRAIISQSLDEEAAREEL